MGVCEFSSAYIYSETKKDVCSIVCPLRTRIIQIAYKIEFFIGSIIRVV